MLYKCSKYSIFQVYISLKKLIDSDKMSMNGKAEESNEAVVTDILKLSLTTVLSKSGE